MLLDENGRNGEEERVAVVGRGGFKRLRELLQASARADGTR